MPPMAVPIAITFCNGIIYVMDDVRSLLQRLRKSYKAIYVQQINESTMVTDMITGIVVYRRAEFKMWSSDRRSCGSSVREVQ
jgi:hypothetical protein